MNKLITIADVYLCKLYDNLWGRGIYRISLRAHFEQRQWFWHEKAAYRLSEFLPPRIATLPWFFQRKIVSRRVRGWIKGDAE